MTTPNSVLNGAQAAGIGLQIYSNYSANKMDRLGTNLDIGQNNIRLQQEQLQSTQMALQATKNLRANLASQAAIAAARGQRSGVGSALAAQNTSQANYNQDINTLSFNQQMKAYDTRFSNDVARMGLQGRKSERSLSLAANVLDTVSINELIQRKGQSPLGKSEKVNP